MNSSSNKSSSSIGGGCICMGAWQHSSTCWEVSTPCDSSSSSSGQHVSAVWGQGSSRWSLLRSQWLLHLIKAGLIGRRSSSQDIGASCSGRCLDLSQQLPPGSCMPWQWPALPAAGCCVINISHICRSSVSCMLTGAVIVIMFRLLPALLCAVLQAAWFGVCCRAEPAAW